MGCPPTCEHGHASIPLYRQSNVRVVDPTTRRFLHVANGTSTTDTIHAAGIPGLTSIWADPLHEGPVPTRLTDEELLDVRARHLAENDRPGIALAETVAELRRWRQAIDDRASYDELVLWYEHDLFDQLNLIQLLTRIGQEPSLDHGRVSLICINGFPGHPRFKGLGELSALELGSLLETRKPVGAEPVRAGGASVGGVPRGRSATARQIAQCRYFGDAISGSPRSGVTSRSFRGRATGCREPSAGSCISRDQDRSTSGGRFR